MEKGLGGDMRYIPIVILLSSCLFLASADNTSSVLNKLKSDVIDIALYAKNPSNTCSLKIRPVNIPHKDICRSAIPLISLEPGRYFRDDIS